MVQNLFCRFSTTEETNVLGGAEEEDYQAHSSVLTDLRCRWFSQI
jgi:hypothetical protein